MSPWSLSSKATGPATSRGPGAAAGRRIYSPHMPWHHLARSDVQDVQKGAMQEVLTQLPAPDDNPNNHIDEGDDEPPAASE